MPQVTNTAVFLPTEVVYSVTATVVSMGNEIEAGTNQDFQKYSQQGQDFK